MASEAQDLRRQLKEAHMSRAMIYAAVYDELCARFGAEVAEAVMTTAIYRRGLAIGQRFAEYGPADLEGVCAAFLEFIPIKAGCSSRRSGAAMPAASTSSSTPAP
jgi:hypothetical protein